MPTEVPDGRTIAIVVGMAAVVLMLTARRANLPLAAATLLLVEAAIMPLPTSIPDANTSDGPALWIILDVSRSMDTRDVGTSRIERAKEIAKSWIDETNSAEIGIIAFAGGSRLIAPLTEDRTFVRSALDSLDTHSAPAGGSNLDSTLPFLPTPDDQDHVVIFLVTDGGQADANWSQFGKAMAKNGSQLAIVGVGDPDKAHPIPLDEGYLEQSGQLVRTSLNADRLRELARVTGGVYIPANQGLVDVRDVWQRHLLPQFGTPSGSRLSVQRFQWLAIAGLAFLTWAMIRSRRSHSPAPQTGQPRIPD